MTACAACLSSASGCAAHTTVALLVPLADLPPGRYAVRHADSRRYLTRGYPRPAWTSHDVSEAILYTPRELALALPTLGSVVVERVS